MMYIEKHYIDSLRDFPAWESAASWLEDAINHDVVDEVEAYIMDGHGENDPLTDTDINDMLWFDDGVHEIIERAILRDQEDEEEDK